ncbi:MAG: Gfo/Idh/MocA family oxidoreductase [Planctomycetaceae bacterium]|nr:Gfo/Idh/MocA family oxidoreductase [Planctomycetaceae bacterium]
MARIRYAQIGVGHAHADKIGVYRKSDDYEVIGVAEPNDALRKRAESSDLYKDLPWMSVEELLNQPGLQVVGVETQVGDLLKYAELAIASEKHIHLDKPAGESLPRFKKLLDAAASKHLTVQMGYMYRFNPAVVLLRQFLKNGWLGEPFEIHTVMSKLMSASARQPLTKYSGGTMFELGCHLIDLVVGVLGEPENVVPFPRHSSTIDDRFLDNMLAVLEYPRATATVRSSVNEVDGFARRHLTVCGSGGTFHMQPLDAPDVTATFLTAHGKYQKGKNEIPFGRYARYEGDAAELAKIVRHEKAPEFGYDHDYAVQKTILLASGLPEE